MSIIVPDDFETGRFKIPLNPKQVTLDLPAYILRVEAYYLPRLFGKELYDLFIADLALPVVDEPTDPLFVFIYNAFVYQDDLGFLDSEGIEDMIKGLVYYEYLRDHITRVTTEGIKQTNGANSSNVSGIQHDLTSRYNESIDTYKTIQRYVYIIKPDDYPTFDGVELNFNHTF